ncbi:MAG: TetR/AcrR family transcriptional regulator [Bacillota bacterium]|nr:TetR/AcrR family transcriptional regulator [Bacillota bacterium]
MKTFKDKEILIFQVTWKLFSEKGFYDIKISEIAKIAGIGKGTVYSYFTSKEELVQKMIIYNLEKAHKEIIETISKVDSPIEKLRLIGKNDINRRMDILKTMKIIQMINDFDKENIKKNVFEMMNKRFIMIENIMSDGIKKNIIQVDSSINSTILYIGTMNNALMVNNFTDNLVNMEEILEFVINLLGKENK